MQGLLKIENIFNPLEEQIDDGRKIGCWSIEQNLLYSIFIDQNKMIMISKKKRKKYRIFDKMAAFVASRNSLQCRSHHQKLIQKLGEIKSIILAFKKYFGKQYYRQQYNFYTKRRGCKKTQETTKTIKIEDNTFIEHTDQKQSESESENEVSQQERSSEEKEIENKEELSPKKQETVFPLCKNEQALSYYFPYNYYFGNNLIQFPYMNAYFTVPPVSQI